jgi:hypothetical protein
VLPGTERETMADRYNFFELPHKGFRMMWAELIGPLGSLDVGDEESLCQLEARLEFATEVYAQHNRDESEWFGPRLCVIDTELTQRWLADHADHEHVLAHLMARARALRVEPDLAVRRELLADFYRFFCEYVADDFEHMSLEQGEIMCAFQVAYDDDQLRELEAQFLAERVSADTLQRLTPLFLRAFNREERTWLLTHLHRRLDPETFAHLMGDVVERAVPARELPELRVRFGYQAA